MKPYTRSEMSPVPDARGPIAERKDYTSHSDPNVFAGSVNGNGVGYQQVPHQASPGPALPPTYFQVLLQKVRERKRLLIVWLGFTAMVAGAVLMNFGKPMWRAEGSLYYSPNFSYSHKRLYTPPNIQTVLLMIKSPEVMEKLRKENDLSDSVESLQSKLTVRVLQNSEIISVGFDCPDKAKAEQLANRVIELSVEKFDQQRTKLSKQAIEDLKENLRKTGIDLQAKKNELNDRLGQKEIFDLASEKSIVQNEISTFEKQISDARTEMDSLRIQIRSIEEQIKRLSMELNIEEGPPSEAELNLLNQMSDLLGRRLKRKQEIEQAKAQLKAKEDELRSARGLLRMGAETKQAVLKLESEVASLKVLTNGTDELNEIERKIKDAEDRILKAPKGAGQLPIGQIRSERIFKQANLDVLPNKIKDLEARRDERKVRERFLQSMEKEAGPIQQEIETLKARLLNLTNQSQEHENVEDNKSELTPYAPAAVGASPSSTNYAKLIVAVFGVSMLLFVGFVAMRDMPGQIDVPNERAAIDQPQSSAQPQLPATPTQGALPHPRSPASRIHGELAKPRSPAPEPTNEQLRALAARIAQSVSDRGSIVLFAPAVPGLRIEALVADLGCYCAETSGKILVFDARADSDHPALPAWAGPNAESVAEFVDDYLEGRSERSAKCFVSTRISAIDYTRADLSKQLVGVVAMYRFRRLVHEMKETYPLVLMIAPDCYHGGEDDFFGNLAEGIIVVLTDDADPAEVDAYLDSFRGGDTPVYGAVSVPPSGA